MGVLESGGEGRVREEPPDVVPVARAPLGALLDALDAAGEDCPDFESHVRAYLAWVTRDGNALHSLAVLAGEAAALAGGARTYRHVAVLGFASASAPGLATAGAAALADGLGWLAGREWFAVGRVATFEADAVALLGVALGVSVHAGTLVADTGDRSRYKEWMAALLRKSLALIADPWERGLIEAARFLVDPFEGAATRVQETAPDLAAALAALGLMTVTPDIERVALDSIFGLSHRGSGPDRAATQRVAIRWLYRAVPAALPGQATVADALTLLGGVPRSLRRWRWEDVPSTRGAPLVRWPVNNEYHVQDLLWVVLAPIFPDLEDEENLPSLGQKHPRYDLGVPSLKLIVEVKFVYRGDRREFSDLIEQVAADASLYLRDKARYSQMVAVVWDDSRHTEQHAELKQGLLAIPGVMGAVVLTRPGRMGPGIRAVEAAALPDDGTASQPGAPPRRRRRQP